MAPWTTTQFNEIMETDSGGLNFDAFHAHNDLRCGTSRGYGVPGTSGFSSLDCVKEAMFYLE